MLWTSELENREGYQEYCYQQLIKWSYITNCDNKLRLHNMCDISLFWEALGFNELYILKNNNNIWHFYFSRFLIKCRNEEKWLALNTKRRVFFCICPKERTEWCLGRIDIYEKEEIYTYSCIHVCTCTQVFIYSWANFCRILLLKQKSDHVTSLLKPSNGFP